MPPKTVFTKEQVINTAYQIIRSEGKEGITARNVAKRLKSSVGPIYTCFQNMSELQEQVILRAASLLEDYMGRTWTDLPFLNMGVGYVCFARDEPILFRELANEKFSDEKDGPIFQENTVQKMRRDTMLSDLGDDDLKDLFVKMSFFAYGMATMASQEGLPDESDEYIINILQEAGGDIIFMTKARSIMTDSELAESKVNKMMGGNI